MSSELRWDDPELQVAGDNRRVARYRALQSWFREHELKAPYGEYSPPGHGKRPCGSLLARDAVAADRGLNFLSDEAAEYADKRVSIVRAEGGTAEEGRLFHNMLSSMPMCFSIFGELRSWGDRGLSVVRELFDPKAQTVELMECEWKPSADRLGDRTAFDAVIITEREDRTRHLIGVETKYTETFSPKSYEKQSYTDVHVASAWFLDGTELALTGSSTNQLWRNTLLAAACEQAQEQGIASSSVCVLAMSDDEGAAKALKGLGEALVEPEAHLKSVSLERLAHAVGAASERGRQWADRFRRRYIDVAPVRAVGLANPPPAG
jgi:hypothetical protein